MGISENGSWCETDGYELVLQMVLETIYLLSGV